METNGTNGNGKTVAIEIAKPTMAKAYEPQTYSEALQMANTLAKSSLLGALKTPEAVFMVMATGAELGIPPTAALRSVHIVQGKPVLSADLIVAVCLRSPLCEYFTCAETTSQQATYETKRKGSGPVRNTFTLEDAKNAGLAGKDNWRNYGKAMLRHRAAAELARMVYPDLVLGIYAEEEIPAQITNADLQRAADIVDERKRYADEVRRNHETRQQEIIDGDIVQAPPYDDSLAKVTAAYVDAKSMEDVQSIRADVARLNLDKGSDDYRALRQLDKEAVERIKAAEQ